MRRVAQVAVAPLQHQQPLARLYAAAVAAHDVRVAAAMVQHHLAPEHLLLRDASSGARGRELAHLLHGYGQGDAACQRKQRRVHGPERAPTQLHAITARSTRPEQSGGVNGGGGDLLGRHRLLRGGGQQQFTLAAAQRARQARQGAVAASAGNGKHGGLQRVHDGLLDRVARDGSGCRVGHALDGPTPRRVSDGGICASRQQGQRDVL
jgi:hypothetical protein